MIIVTGITVMHVEDSRYYTVAINQWDDLAKFKELPKTRITEEEYYRQENVEGRVYTNQNGVQVKLGHANNVTTYLGLPFEAMEDAENMNQMMRNLLACFKRHHKHEVKRLNDLSFWQRIKHVFKRQETLKEYAE